MAFSTVGKLLGDFSGAYKQVTGRSFPDDACSAMEKKGQLDSPWFKVEKAFCATVREMPEIPPAYRHNMHAKVLNVRGEFVTAIFGHFSHVQKTVCNAATSGHYFLSEVEVCTKNSSACLTYTGAFPARSVCEKMRG